MDSAAASDTIQKLVVFDVRGFAIQHLVQFFRSNRTVKQLRFENVEFVGQANERDISAAHPGASDQTNPLEILVLDDNNTFEGNETAMAFAKLVAHRSTCSAFEVGSMRFAQIEDIELCEKEFFRTILGPSAVKSPTRVIARYSCDPRHLKFILTAAKASLEVLDVESNFFDDSGPKFDILTIAIPQMAKLKRLVLQLNLDYGGISAARTSRLLTVLEERNATIVEVVEHGRSDVFSQAEKQRLNYLAERNRGVQNFLDQPSKVTKELAPIIAGRTNMCPNALFPLMENLVLTCQGKGSRGFRFSALEELLTLRGRKEMDAAQWEDLVEDGDDFSLTIVQGGVAPRAQQILSGVSAVIADAEAFHVFLQTLGSGQGTVTCRFQCDRESFWMEGCQAGLDWTATIVGARAEGAPLELAMEGHVRGMFSPDTNKLLSAKISYDTGPLILPLALNDEPEIGAGAGCCRCS